MSSSTTILRDYLRPLLVQPAWHGVAGYGSWLRLNFGNPSLVVTEPRPNASLESMRHRLAIVEGAFQLWIEMGAWTLHQPGRRMVHSGSTRYRMQQAVAALEGQILVDLVCTHAPLKTTFLFDEGSVLEVYPNEGAKPDEPLWHFYSGARMLQVHACGDLCYGPIAQDAPYRRRLDDGTHSTFQRSATRPPIHVVPKQANQRGMPMQVKAWCNGGLAYGIRIGIRNRDHHFQRDWCEIEVELDGTSHSFRLTPGFWRSCPEFRDAGAPVIRRWLERRGALTWPSGKPPRFELVSMGLARFRLVG